MRPSLSARGEQEHEQRSSRQTASSCCKDNNNRSPVDRPQVNPSARQLVQSKSSSSSSSSTATTKTRAASTPNGSGEANAHSTTNTNAANNSNKSATLSWQTPSTSANYLAGLVNKSSSLFDTLKQQYTNVLRVNTARHPNDTNQQEVVAIMQSTSYASQQQPSQCQHEAAKVIGACLGESNESETTTTTLNSATIIKKGQQKVERPLKDNKENRLKREGEAEVRVEVEAKEELELQRAEERGKADCNKRINLNERGEAKQVAEGEGEEEEEEEEEGAKRKEKARAFEEELPNKSNRPSDGRKAEFANRNEKRDTITAETIATMAPTLDQVELRKSGQQQQQQQQQQHLIAGCSGAADLGGTAMRLDTPKKPPLPPPPPRELVEACALRSTPVRSLVTATRSEEAGDSKKHQQSGVLSNPNSSSSLDQIQSKGPRRDALQELSLERDAALSFKSGSNNAKESKHKRTSSIRSALRHASHLGPLRSSAARKRLAAEKAAALGGSQQAGSLIATASTITKSTLSNSKRDSKAINSKSKPYELFEPPITQRTVERSKRRRGAMQCEASTRRQLSADTIALRQLTDEYLENAGVKQFIKPITALNSSDALTSRKTTTLAGSSSRSLGSSWFSSSMVALSRPLSQEAAATKPGTIAVPGGSSTVAAIAAANSAHDNCNSMASSQAECALEAQLFQATRQAAARFEQQQQNSEPTQSTNATNQWLSSRADDEMRRFGHLNERFRDSNSPPNQVTVLPGSLPWQCDVSIQCELLQAPPVVEPYETTGDILNTIARPFRGPPLNSTANHSAASFDTNHHNHHHHHHHLSATLKRGLSAISQHHLSPSGASSAGSMALNVVVGSLKKSISNTFDANNKQASGNLNVQSSNCECPTASGNFLRSQDSLPAYSNLLNEPDDDDSGADSRSIGWPARLEPNVPNHEQQTGLIGHLASKLTRQSSKKFAVSRKGLQRALSFDYRGYKRLDGQQQQQQQQQSPLKTQTTLVQSSALQTSADSTASSCASTSSAAATITSSSLAANRQKTHNKSALALQSPRPYLPQSASQVDFQVPLLPYERMQEAIVSQRLLDPAPPPPPSSNEKLVVETQADPSTVEQQNRASRQQNLNADELICGTGIRTTTTTTTTITTLANQMDDCDNTSGPDKRNSKSGPNYRTPNRPMRLVLDIAPDSETSRIGCEPQVVIDPDDDEFAIDVKQAQFCCSSISTTNASRNSTLIACSPSPNVIIDSSFGLNDRQSNELTAAENSPMVMTPGQMSQSPSFCIDPDGKSASLKHHNQQQQSIDAGNGFLTASDVFNKSKNFIKRPSTMMAGDEGVEAMNQVVQALESKAAKQLVATSSVRSRNRRQAIVPPKLATDACASPDSETNQPQCAKLVDLTDEDVATVENDDDRADANEQLDRRQADEVRISFRHRDRPSRKRSGEGRGQQRKEPDEFGAEEEEALKTIRRKRSGGGIEKSVTPNVPRLDFNHGTRTSCGQVSRPDSRATNADSIVSSGSSTTLSALAAGRLSANSAGFGCSDGGTGGASSGAVSPMGGATLSVPFGNSAGGGSSSRRRSSIAVIPQMQICPGDLLVYSKQLIERMNQTDENEPPQFLTIDDKKGKNNIWSSFKLCAQFDNRTLRARNELLCSLEDVLASLQPSTFVDEQLSHYKGMLWNEFLYETESHRSASSNNASRQNSDQEDWEREEMGVPKRKSYRDDLIDVRITTPSPVKTSTPSESTAINENDVKFASSKRDNSPIRLTNTMSSPPSQEDKTGKNATLPTSRSNSKVNVATVGQHQQKPVGAPLSQQRAPLSSRFREKPKLKRGQTVDSVFRIPLIPSSPLKHAQQHQQTPTAHLEDHELAITIEDDERSSVSSATSGASRKRSSSTRSRSGSRPIQTLPAGNGQTQQTLNSNSNGAEWKSQDSSFDTDDANDLMGGPGSSTSQRRRQGGAATTPNQIVRQSSLSTLSSTITRTEQKRQRALWDLFQSECTFFFDHLMTLKNVYMEPLKKIQVEGFAMFADPDVLFGNLDELCCDVYDFCKEFLYIIMRTLKTRPEELNATDVLIKLYKKNPKIDHLRAVYHRYTLNYINALTYLESLRRQVEFVEFEKWSSRDVRCKKLQLTDLLVAPVQHIMRVPIILKDIEGHTERPKDRDEIRAILAVEEASLRELDDKMRWLKNFERLLEIQKNINWPSVLDMDSKLYVPEFLKEVLSKQPCEKLIVSPRRQIVHEGTLSNFDLGGKPVDMHVILFDDMLLITRRKKALTKKASTVVCKTNSVGGGVSSSGSATAGSSSGPSGSSLMRDDGSYKYVVYKQPLSLDRFYVHDVQQADSQSIGIKHLFLLIVMNRFQQIIGVHSFGAPNDDLKQTWLFKIKKTVERWKRNLSSNSGSNAANNSSEQNKQQVQTQQPRQLESVSQGQQQQQQQISASKSMPMDALGGSKLRSNSSKRQSNREAIASKSAEQNVPMPKRQVQTPIEFVITSATESPASQQQRSPSDETSCATDNYKCI